MSRFFAPALALLVLLASAAQAADKPPGTETIPAAALIQPAALADMLKAGKAPTILQVGFSALYDQSHIPAALYAGPTRSEDGIKNLKGKADALPHDKLVVIYCGCCPWVKCPNVAAAYQQLTAMGFSNA